MRRSIKLICIVLSVLVLLPVILSGCSQNKKVVATVGDYEIYYEFIRHATLNFKIEMDALYGNGNDEDGTIWDDPVLAEEYRPILEKKVWNLTMDQYAVLVTCARYGIGQDILYGDAMRQTVNESLEDLKSEYASTSDYKASLKATYMTEDVFRLYFTVEEAKKLLLGAIQKNGECYTDKDLFHSWLLEGNYACVQHVMRKVEENESPEMERAYLQVVYDALANGKTRDGIADYIGSSFNDDLTNTDSYFMIRGIHDDRLVDAALTLWQPGDFTEIIELDDSFYILSLMEEEEGKLSEQLASLLSLHQWGVVGDKVEEVRSSIAYELTEFGQTLDLLAIK